MLSNRQVLLLLLVAAALFPAQHAAETAQKKLLVVVKEEADRQIYSKFLASLESLGQELDVRLSSDKSLQLRNWDEWLYTDVIILHPASEFGGAVDNAGLLEFVDAGGNLLLAVESDVSDAVRELAQDVGVDIETSGTAVIDHFSNDGRDAAHTSVLASNFLKSKAIFGDSSPKAPVVFQGVGLSVAPASQLALVVLSASQTAYSAGPQALREDPTLAGCNIGLAAVVQPRSGARVAVLGSVHMLSDAAFEQDVPSGSGHETQQHSKRRVTLERTPVRERSVQAGNQEFASAITKWLFHQRGKLRFGKFVHRKMGGSMSEQPTEYRIKDHLLFSVQIEELVDGAWQPYRAEDVQLEFVMLDPYVRVNLAHDAAGVFSRTFQVPDVYGVFKFVVDYGCPGYNHVQLSEQIPVRPFKHNEFDRFLTPAYPYYTTAVTTMLAFAVLTAVFLYS